MMAAVIPTRYHPPELERLLRVLDDDGIPTFVMESEKFNHSIYRMWNVGREHAKAIGADHVAILNDDITIHSGTLLVMSNVLRKNPDIGVVYPDYRNGLGSQVPGEIFLEATEGTWGAGGMTGFCFMLNGKLPLPDFDEAFNLWCGDDAFEAGVRAAGFKVARVIGLPIEHVPGDIAGSTKREIDYWKPRIEADLIRWESMKGSF